MGFAGAEVDRLAETKGEDAWDREKAKRQAEQNSRDLYDQQCESIFLVPRRESGLVADWG